MDSQINLIKNNIVERTNGVIEESKQVTKVILNIKLTSISNINKCLTLLSNDIDNIYNHHIQCIFLQSVSSNKKLRNNCYNADLLLTTYINELNFNEKLYIKLLELKNSNLFLQLEKIDQLFVEKLLTTYQRYGCHLNNEKRQNLLKLNHEISKLEILISSEISYVESSTLDLDTQDLLGIPEKIINSYVKNNSSYITQFNKYNYNLFMKHMSNPSTRKNIESLYSKKFERLSNHFSKLIVLQNKKAKILSYNSYSDYKVNLCMVKNSKNVINFLSEILAKLEDRYKKETRSLITFNNSKQLYSYDISYCLNKWKLGYGINDDAIKEYFELSNTTREIIKIYESLFNIKFVEQQPDDLWAPNIQVYSITFNGSTIGMLYLDLYYREHKYKQTRCYSLRASNTTTIPHIALVSTINRYKDTHYFVAYNELISLFHEFGHVMHIIFSQSKYSIFDGVNVERDFIEAPAQMLELICWEPHIIKQISKHYRTGEQLSDEIIVKLVKIKNMDISLQYKKNILIALFDQILYSSEKFIQILETNIINNTNIELIIHDIHSKLYSEIMGSEIKLNDIYFMPSEIFHNFDNSNYMYSSIWSKTMAIDMYMQKIKNKPINHKLGFEIINKLFKPGNIKNGYDMVCDFLGRKPTIDNFISTYELNIDAEYSFYVDSSKINYQPIKPNNSIHKTNYSDEITVTNKFSEITESDL